jgi:EAL domain-containing protein (putative c-di-GMP-specific phosphodiesterase class I)
MEQGKPFSATDNPLVDFDAVCQKVRAAVEPARAHAVSLHDERGDLLWLSESSMGPDEHNAVREAIDAFGAPGGPPILVFDLGDSRSAVLLRAVNARREMVGAVMVVMDARGVKQDARGAHKMMTPKLQRALADFAAMLPESEPPPPPVPAARAAPPAHAAAAGTRAATLPPAAVATRTAPHAAPGGGAAPAVRPAPAARPAPATRVASPPQAAPANRAAAVATTRTAPATRAAPAARPVFASQRPVPAQASPAASPIAAPRTLAPARPVAAQRPIAAPPIAAVGKRVQAAVTPEIDRLHAALRRSPIALHVQRLVPLSKGSQLTRYEVLLRAAADTAPNAAPQAMLKAAVEAGLGSMIDRRVVTQLIGWLIRHPDVWKSTAVMFSVNLTSTAVHDEHFIKFVGLCLAKAALPKGMIAFEVDTPTAVKLADKMAEVAAALHRLGCPLVLDDFALRTECFALLRLPGVRYVKLASEITAKMRTDKLSQAAITAVVQMARVLGMHTVAKRTESAAEQEWLTALGVDFVQSNSMSPPVAIESLSTSPTAPRPQSPKREPTRTSV